MNSSHRPTPYFEWFYFHFLADNGVVMNMVLHETDIFGIEQAPYLSLSILKPNQKPQYLRRDLKGIEIARDQPHLQVGNGIITESAWAIRIDIAFPGSGHLQAEINKLTSPVAIHDGILYEEPGTGRTSNWVVNVPHAVFTGILNLDGAIQRLSGTAYQDHQWGTICIQEFVSDWVWGHFSNPQTAVVFFQILSQRGQLIERVAMIHPEGRFTGTFVDTNYLDTLFYTDRPDSFSASINVAFLNHQLRLVFDISPENLMRSRLGEEHNSSLASYLRWSAAASIGCNPQPLHGISEYIRIRPAMYGELNNK